MSDTPQRSGPVESSERVALLAAARRGDHRAFEALFAPDLDLAWRMARRSCGSSDLADEALGDGLLAAYRALDRVEPRNLRAWFVRIVINAARDAARRERRRAATPLTDERDAGHDPDRVPRAGRGSDPLDRALTGELAATLEAALDRLPTEQREAILLADIEGLDHAEIAALAGVAVGTVKSRISRGREALRALLTREGTVRPSVSLRESHD